ncbi:polysaccharide deacetylase family protein [Brevibacillus nitrificans]|uniref:polysaccharide deacetylase family protein n=1 Tax=Brevibacillus nitrificans TaxID=651560 RepID=UPI002856699F|nr:polysaccharide deacetylase family protein [Brevibacillus nitrificans]MDR7318122.1 polysaccharide deacetylase family sporulation protein PdaB [Brevibacillus nitrificans]
MRHRAIYVCLIACLLGWGIMPVWAGASTPFYEPIHRIQTQKKVVALTFDDGPDAKYTPKILEVLHQNNIRATFFVLGSQVDKHPRVMQWIYKAGHEIGNHGYHHLDLNKLTEHEVYEDIKHGERSILRTTGILAQYYRPPGGVMTHDVMNAVQSSGYDIIHWSVDPRDWSLARTASVIAKSVKSNVSPGDIILFHDGGLNQRQTVAALQELITDLRSQGYRFVTVSQLLDAAK